MCFWSHLNNAHTDSIKWGTWKKKGFYWQGASNAGIITPPPHHLGLYKLFSTWTTFIPPWFVLCPSWLLCALACWPLHTTSVSPTNLQLDSVSRRENAKEDRAAGSGQGSPSPSQPQCLISSSSCILHSHSSAWWPLLGDSSSHWAFVTLLPPLASSVQGLKQCPTVIGLEVTHHL